MLFVTAEKAKYFAGSVYCLLSYFIMLENIVFLLSVIYSHINNIIDLLSKLNVQEAIQYKEPIY